MPSSMCTLKGHATPDQRVGVGLQRERCAAASSARISMVLRRRRCSHDSGSVIEPEAQLHPQDHEDREVGAMAGAADARIEDAPVAAAASGRRSTAEPAMPPETIASICFCGALMNGSYIQCGVSCPNRWPKNRNRMPTWNRLLPQRSVPVAQHLRRVALPRVLVAVEARQAAHAGTPPGRCTDRRRTTKVC